jgi:hypothetical protein
VWKPAGMLYTYSRSTSIRGHKDPSFHHSPISHVPLSPISNDSGHFYHQNRATFAAVIRDKGATRESDDPLGLIMKTLMSFGAFPSGSTKMDKVLNGFRCLLLRIGTSEFMIDLEISSSEKGICFTISSSYFCILFLTFPQPSNRLE